MSKRKTLFDTCREYSVAISHLELSYTLDEKFQGSRLTVGQRVTLRVRRRPGRYKLVGCVALHEIDSCECGACDYVVKTVAVPFSKKDEFLAQEAEKPSFEEWWTARSHR